jgi:hypothetical protein
MEFVHNRGRKIYYKIDLSSTHYYSGGYWSAKMDGVNQNYESPSDTQSHYYRDPSNNSWYLWSSGAEGQYSDGCNNYNYMPEAKFKRNSDGSIIYYDKARFTKRTGGI